MSNTVSQDLEEFDYILTDDKDDIDLLMSFKESYPDLAAIGTKEQFLTMVNLNSGIRDWYLTYKKYRSTFLVKPAWLSSDKDSLDNWAKLQDKLASQKKMFRSWDVRIESKSIALKKEIEKVDAEKKQYMKTMDPLIAISSLTVNNLPVSDTLQIALEGDKDLRKILISSKVEKLKSSMYAALNNGTFQNPFLK